jgi:hypothetical protein
MKYNINLITQYFRVVNSKNIVAKQNEIDYVLKTNCNNKYINKIFLLLEKDYEFLFLSELEKNKIVKIIIGKRLTYQDAFNFYNNQLKNQIAILSNSDIYFDDSLEILNKINWNLKLVIAPTRYEHYNNSYDNVIYGYEQELGKQCSWVKSYQESIYAQDVWIWCNEGININKQYNCEFNLGMLACDNHIAYIFHKNNYTMVASSKYICCNHYDHLSCGTNLIKGGESYNRTRIGEYNTHRYLDSGNELVDIYVNETYNYTNKGSIHIYNHILHTKCESNIRPLTNKLKNFQIYSSSNESLCLAYNAKINSLKWWQPKIDDYEKCIIIKYHHLLVIPYIDIQGMAFSRDNKYKNGYVKKITIYSGKHNDHFSYFGSFDGITINNFEFIKRIYFDKPLICTSLKIKIDEYYKCPAMRFEIYYDSTKCIEDIDKTNKSFKNFIFNALYFGNNRQILEFEKLFNKELLNVYSTNLLNFDTNYDIEWLTNNKYYNEFFDHNKINRIDYWNNLKETLYNDYKITQNILGQEIMIGTCIFICIMNRRQNLINNLNSWLKPQVNQLIILDWSSNENNYDIVCQKNDNRILYIRVENEKSYIRTYAQNLAVQFSRFNKILKLDSDVIIKDNFFENNVLNEGEFIVGNFLCARDENERSTHGNIYLFLNDYMKIGGYNELIQTYGNDDSDFSFRLQMLGCLKEKILDLNTIYHVPHSNESRKQNMNGVYNAMVEVFKHRIYIDKMPLWLRHLKNQKFSVKWINSNYIECNRINKQNMYTFSSYIYAAENYAINMIYDWNKNLYGWKISNDIEYKKLILSNI